MKKRAHKNPLNQTLARTTTRGVISIEVCAALNREACGKKLTYCEKMSVKKCQKMS
jgi:hypothetical protein